MYKPDIRRVFPDRITYGQGLGPSDKAPEYSFFNRTVSSQIFMQRSTLLQIPFTHTASSFKCTAQNIKNII